MPLRISAEKLAGKMTVALEGDLDAASAYDVVRRVGDLRADGCRDLVLDLTGVREVDQAGLSRLLWCVRRSNGPGRVRLLARRSALQRLLTATEYADLVVTPGRHQPLPRPREAGRSRRAPARAASPR